MRIIQNYKLLFVVLIISVSNAQTIEIDNSKARRDINGKIVDAHDGRIIQFGDTFYWYGTSYGNTNGFTTQNYYRCYSSKDLNEWKDEGKLLVDQPEGVYYRPHVIYNQRTKKYVLWYNWYPKLWNGQFGVATSDKPTGPFIIVNNNVSMYNSEIGLGDFGLFVDDDGAGYISYNTIKNHQVSIEKLADDYLSSTMENGGVIAEHMEAGSMFKNGNKYYLLTDYTCCFCNYGSGARVYISDDPLKGYAFTTNINRYPGRYTAILKDQNKRGTHYEKLSKTENTFEAVEILFESKKMIDQVTLYLFTGNRPENCGNVNNPKVHPDIETPSFDIFEWKFDTWEKISLLNQEVSKSALQEKIDLKFEKTFAHRFKIVPKTQNFSKESIFVNELETFFASKEMSLNEASIYVTSPKIPQKPIVPAQQSYVLQLRTTEGDKFIWIGDLWGSASDNIKGHDYQYWSAPLKFNNDGTILPMKWTDQWKVTLETK